MTILDNGWTEDQARGLLDSLMLKGSTPHWKLEHLQDYTTGAHRTKRNRPPSKPSLSLLPMNFSIHSKP